MEDVFVYFKNFVVEVFGTAYLNTLPPFFYPLSAERAEMLPFLLWGAVRSLMECLGDDEIISWLIDVCLPTNDVVLCL